MLEFLVMFSDKRLGADDAGVGKVSGAIGETVDFAEFEIFFPLFFNDCIIDPFSLNRSDRAFFI